MLTTRLRALLMHVTSLRHIDALLENGLLLVTSLRALLKNACLTTSLRHIDSISKLTTRLRDVLS
jgi:hypothetical protein